MGPYTVGVQRRIGVANHEGAESFTEVVVVDSQYARLDHLRVSGQQVLDFQRKHVLSAGHDHVVVTTVDEPQAVGGEMTGVPR